MTTAKKDAGKRISDYIESLPEWSKNICLTLRTTILSASPGLTEEWKWGPHYSSAGMVCGFSAFQKHVKVTFFNGAGMQDGRKLFNHCVDNEFSRSIKYDMSEAVDTETLAAYVQEAVALNAKGFKREIKDKTVSVPPELTAALSQSKEAQIFFEGLSYGYKKEFAEHVAEARQETTKQARIAKIIGLCTEGKTLHHKYKK